MGLEDEPLAQILGEMNEDNENFAYEELQSQMNEKQRNIVLLLITIMTRYCKINLLSNIYCVVCGHVAQSV
jgi:hypothetical protein